MLGTLGTELMITMLGLGETEAGYAWYAWYRAHDHHARVR